jgi:hypothetical protein
MGEHMTLRSAVSFILVATLAGSVTASAQSTTEVPTPDLLVRRAWEEAGGLEAYNRLGIVRADFTTEETTQEGKPSTTLSKAWLVAPGPNPGRIELANPNVISGDDGTMGWAMINGKYDPRQSTQIMIKRLLVTKFFTLTLPFSLNWSGVILKDVQPTTVKGVPVWRLTIDVVKGFFHSPQIATTWRIDFNRATYAVVQAESPATDMGKGIQADGMRVSWSKYQAVQGVMLPGEQRTIGLSEVGSEKAHSRIDRVRYELVPKESFKELFSNPVPPELRPTPPPILPKAPARPPQA